MDSLLLSSVLFLEWTTGQDSMIGWDCLPLWTGIVCVILVAGRASKSPWSKSEFSDLPSF